MIRLEHMEDVAVVYLARGRGNSLESGFLAEIRNNFEALRDAPPRGVILAADGRIWCAGLDLLALADATGEDLGLLLDELHATLREVFTFPRPVVAAINGHALAGGALLSLACDQRVMAMGDAKWGLTEAQLGLVVPASMIEMSRYALRRPVLERLLYGGQAYPGFKAREMGILDDIVEGEELLERSLEIIRGWTPVPSAFADIKARLRQPTVDAMEAARPQDRAFMARWMEPEVQALMGPVVERLRGDG